jgi:hypothetical protein
MYFACAKKSGSSSARHHPRACLAIALEGEFAGEMPAGPGDIVVDVLLGDAHVGGGDLADDCHVTHLDADEKKKKK